MRKVTIVLLLFLFVSTSYAMSGSPPAERTKTSASKLETGRGGSKIFFASADTWVYEGKPNKNYGDGLGWKDITNPDQSYSVPRVFIGFSGSDLEIGLFKFDLTGLDKTKSVKKATLKIFNCFAGSDAGLYVDAKMITSPWDESTVTFNNLPKTGETLSTVLFKGHRNYNDPGKWYEFDVTKAVQAWQRGEKNYGIMLYPQGKYGVDFEFVCRESAGAKEFGPRLEVTY